MPEIRIFPDRDTLTHAAVQFFTGEALAAVQRRGCFSAAVAGGSTPKPVYKRLGQNPTATSLPWDKVHLFWGDERHVPPQDPQSNYRMVRETLLEKIEIPDQNIHRVPAEMEVRLAAFNYEEILREYFDSPWPRFDLVVLGMGDDGHTASLFPHSAGLNEAQRWFIANFAPDLGDWRLTLTKHAINAARQIAVLVVGESKSEMVARVLEGDFKPESYPIQLVAPENGHLTWFLDQQAASKLSLS